MNLPISLYGLTPNSGSYAWLLQIREVLYKLYLTFRNTRPLKSPYLIFSRESRDIGPYLKISQYHIAISLLKLVSLRTESQDPNYCKNNLPLNAVLRFSYIAGGGGGPYSLTNVMY